MDKVRLYRRAKNPMTEKYEDVTIIEDHFAPGVDGYKFGCGTIYNGQVVPIKIQKV
jgi:hypothetical protein